MLILRREALHNRTSIPKDEIVPVVFNEHAYYEFKWTENLQTTLSSHRSYPHSLNGSVQTSGFLEPFAHRT